MYTAGLQTVVGVAVSGITYNPAFKGDSMTDDILAYAFAIFLAILVFALGIEILIGV